MIESRGKFALALLILATACLARSNLSPADAPAQPCWEQLLWWLPEDTETIIVAPQQFQVHTSKPESNAPKDLPKTKPADPAKPAADPAKAKPAKEGNAPTKLEEMVQGLVSGSVIGGDKGINLDLSRLKIQCAVEGSRCFTPPKNFGMMLYQGCQILKFETAATAAVQKAFDDCLAKAENKRVILGHQIAINTVKSINRHIVQDDWTYYVCQPTPGVLLVATHQGYLEETLKRIQTKPKHRALPATLPEWKHVDTKAQVWAIRHYNEKTAKEDPLSPLNPQAAGSSSDPAAIGFVFWFTPARINRAYCRYLSGPDADVKLFAVENWPSSSEELAPKIRKVGPGVLEIVANVSDEHSTGVFLFVLLGFVGHAVIL